MVASNTLTNLDSLFLDKVSREHLNKSGIGDDRIRRVVSKTHSLPLTLDHNSTDIDPFEGIETKVFLACTSRSGSTYLGQLLGCSPEFPELRENLKPWWFEWAQKRKNAKSLVGAIREIVKHHSSGSVYGLKSEFDHLIRLFQIGEFPKNLRKWKWVFLKRRNKVGQAISIVKAMQTRKWVSGGEIKGTPAREEDYDRKRIQQALIAIERKNSLWKSFLDENEIPFFEIDYEEVETNRLSSIKNIYGFIGFTGSTEFNFSKIKAEKMRDNISENWEKKFREETNDPDRLED